MIDPNPRRPAPRLPAKPVRVTRDLWWHCLDTSGIITFAVALAAWLLPRTLPLPLLTGILATATAVSWWVTLRTTASFALASWLLASGSFLTCWFTAARMLGAWTEYVLAALVLGFVILFPLGPPAIGHYRAMDKRDPEADERARQKAELAEWEGFFARACKVRGIQVVTVRKHPNGVQVHGYLGKATDEHGVVTFDRLKELPQEIATDLRLAGDAVTFEQPDPDNSAAFVMHLRTRKGRRKIVYLPESTRITSINEPVELGLHDNGGKFRLLLREIAVMIVGVIGAGKSNLLNVLIGQLARCEDVLVFTIDLKGGRMARPWIQPWVEDPDEVRRPVIDWLATTRTEAKLMLEALIAGGDARARSGAGGEKITPRRDLPAVALVMDETAVATGHGRKDDDVSSRELAVLLARLVETYRSEGFVPVVAAVRGDVETMGLSAVKAQVLARIGLRVSQSADADSVFPDDHATAKVLSKIQDEGAGLVLLKGKMSPPVHFYRVTPKLAYWIARRTGPYRPAPDPVLETGLGEAYATRWERMQDTLDNWAATAAVWREDAGIDADLSGPPAKAGPALRDRPGGGDDPEDYVGSVVDEVLGSVIASIENPGGRVHKARQRMRELLYQAGPDGMRIGDINKILCAEASRSDDRELAVHRGTLHSWLKQDEEHGRVRREGGLLGDPYARWIWIGQAGDAGPLGGLGRGPRDDDGEGDDW